MYGLRSVHGVCIKLRRDVTINWFRLNTAAIMLLLLHTSTLVHLQKWLVQRCVSDRERLQTMQDQHPGTEERTCIISGPSPTNTVLSRGKIVLSTLFSWPCSNLKPVPVSNAAVYSSRLFGATSVFGRLYNTLHAHLRYLAPAFRSAYVALSKARRQWQRCRE